MSLMCECPRCGGNDDFAMCENALLDARMSVHRSEKTVSKLNFLLGVLVVLFLITVTLPTEKKTAAPESPKAGTIQTPPMKDGTHES